ncbi:hypothetical protein BO79DRAFT_280122 [Aspergillus costaricaensis CBS 115574]|uniref:Uncharacterized protein n=1 Tax=Aspergillus costaricaensis CBS 115574 TaxID=1448317 RepID=A0ACD1HXR6_9EURO|nr:hypothetical protein BO79DRAFT_280122 [Aspergillus costaricaensis CBS 115574]RAK82860.1 hypothetical protein BO79DRAFT_280122 [Aspergillus costaricaensis CBS 115574]
MTSGKEILRRREEEEGKRKENQKRKKKGVDLRKIKREKTKQLTRCGELLLLLVS